MPRTDEQPNLLASVLDRLIDEEPGSTRDSQWRNRHDVAQLKKTVARDLEALLNTRMELLDEVPAEFTQVTRSPLTYGLPDLTSLSASNQKDRNRVRRVIEQAIETFEPRLKNVRVILDPPRDKEILLRFRIQALLPVEPNPEPVAFDTDLQMDSRRYVVRG